MANDAELVIKLPKELKESLDNVREEAALDYIQVHNATFYHALKNANVLPERHGRIIDESKITSVSYHVDQYKWLMMYLVIFVSLTVQMLQQS